MTNTDMPNTVYKRTTISGDIVLRNANEKDLPKLEWFGEYLHFRRLFRYTYQEQIMRRRLMLIAEFNDFPIGQIFIFFKDDNLHDGSARGYLYSLRVMEPFQKHGIGTKLILSAEQIVKQRRLPKTTIAVAKENHVARRLYERLGYRITHEDEGKWSYTNHMGETIYMHEPCWMLEKTLLHFS